MRKFDADEAQKLNAEQWQLDLLNRNPNYTCWGPHEDYMYNTGSGWDSRVLCQSWADFTFNLDDLNECVNFYFSVERESVECPTCKGNGYHADAQEVVNTFYAHMNDRGEHWNDKITDDEVAALIEAGRLPKGSTASEVNSSQRGFPSHDAINRLILTETRLKRLGLPVYCDKCEGHGYVYTADRAHVSLVLWILHPRKGCSRGVEIKNIQHSDLPEVFAYLQQAAQRNACRFSGVGS